MLLTLIATTTPCRYYGHFIRRQMASPVFIMSRRHTTAIDAAPPLLDAIAAPLHTITSYASLRYCRYATLPLLPSHYSRFLVRCCR